MKKVTVEEIYAFTGLYLSRRLYKRNTLPVGKLFSNDVGPPIFSATMSRNRIVFIRADLSLDDETTRENRWQHDCFAATREFFEVFNFQCITCLMPGDYLSLDETLYPMCTQISFKQYNPNKPAKCGLLLKAINAAYYPCNPLLLINAPGKAVEDPEEYYVFGTLEVVKKMVDHLESIVSLAGRKISFDRLFISIPFALWLYQKNITSLGTMQINRKGIPTEIRDIKQREPLSSEIYCQKDGRLSLSSYVVKSSTGKRMSSCCQLFLSRYWLPQKMIIATN